MTKKHHYRPLVFLILLLFVSFALPQLQAADLIRREWNIEGVTREALIHIPADAKTKPAPVVFGFHGHGGSMQNAARMFHIETLWPDAIVVYMQGLNTPGRLTDPEGKKPGWQMSVGNQGDRDLKFFDAVLASLKQDYKIDRDRVYSTGHSNGGAFTYLLWAARPKDFTAFAPCAALLPELVKGSINIELGRAASTTNTITFIPKPVLHIAGKNDPLVKFEWQRLMIAAVRQRNECGEGKPWDQDKRCMLCPAKRKADVLAYIHDGTHKYPEEAPEMIVKFFKEQALPH